MIYFMSVCPAHGPGVDCFSEGAIADLVGCAQRRFPWPRTALMPSFFCDANVSRKLRSR